MCNYIGYPQLLVWQQEEQIPSNSKDQGQSQAAQVAEYKL